MTPLAIGGLGVPELLILLVLGVLVLVGPLLLILSLTTRPRGAPMGAGRVVLVVLGSIMTAVMALLGLIVVLQLT